MSIEALVGTGRRLIATTLLDGVLVVDRELTPDGQGGVTEEWVPRTSTEPIPCKFGQLIEGDERGRVQRPTGGSTDSTAQGVLTFPAEETTVGESDIVVDVATGRSWLVVGETTPPSVTAVSRRLLIREE